MGGWRIGLASCFQSLLVPRKDQLIGPGPAYPKRGLVAFTPVEILQVASQPAAVVRGPATPTNLPRRICALFDEFYKGFKGKAGLNIVYYASGMKRKNLTLSAECKSKAVEIRPRRRERSPPSPSKAFDLVPLGPCMT